MTIRKSALNMLIISVLVGLAALVLTLLGLGMKFNFGAKATLETLPLLVAIAIAAAVSLVFGWVRYSRNGGLTLGFAVLHDQLLSLALCAILSLVLGLGAYAPAFLLAGAAFTYVFTVPVLRVARAINRSGARAEGREQAAEAALRQIKPLRFLALAAAVLMLLAFLVSGNLAMAGAVLPLVTGLIVALYSSCLITPYVWAALKPRHDGKK